MFIPIEKWHGAKNDFIVTWMLATDRDTVLESLKRLAPKLCSRDGSGVGADGILVLEVKTRKDIYPQALHIVNQDGSLASNCGNGLRCAAMSVRRRAHADGQIEFDGVTLTVKDIAFDCRFMGKPRNPFVAVTMPVPMINEANSWHTEVVSAARTLRAATNIDVATVGLGNPHVVLTMTSSISAELAQTWGKSLQSTRGGDGINVHLCESLEVTDADHKRAKDELGEPIGELYKVIPFERGVGLTQACGSGASAVAVVAYESGMTERRHWIALDMPGGRLYAKQSEENDPVILAGPAVFVFSGEVEI